MYHPHVCAQPNAYLVYWTCPEHLFSFKLWDMAKSYPGFCKFKTDGFQPFKATFEKRSLKIFLK